MKPRISLEISVDFSVSLVKILSYLFVRNRKKISRPYQPYTEFISSSRI